MVANLRAQGFEPEDVCRLLIETIHRLQATEVSKALRIMHESGLTLPQILTLHVLESGPLAVGAIATRIQLSPAATSHLVERMVCLGLVERCEHAEDRRQKQVSLSRRGASLTDRLRRARMAGLSVGLARLSPRTRASFSRSLSDVLGELPRPVSEGSV